jgi:U3 small nucleolar RNA-associated protein 12
VAKEGYLVSSSKDTLLKLWDLSAQFCRETIVGHRSEVWSFAISNDRRIILSGGSEPNVKAWKIDWRVLGLSLEALGTVDETTTQNTNKMDVDDDDDNSNKGDDLKAATLQKAITLYGTLPRHSKERISTIRFHSSGEFVGVQAADKSVQLYRIRDFDYIRKKIQRRRKRAKEKGKSVDEVNDEIQVEDEIKSQTIIRTPAKVGSFDFAPVKDVAKAGHVQVRL